MEQVIKSNLRPGPGHVVRDYELNNSSGQPMMLSDYRGKSNLVLITSQVGSKEVAELLHDLDFESARLREYEAQVVVISSRDEGIDLPSIRLVIDDRGNALGDLGAPAVYITDKFREVIHRFDRLASAGDILGWVEFTEIKCPECHPSEWPPVE